MLFDPIKEIPGYAEAVEKQDFVRDVAFLGVPEILCGIEVAPLTFRHLLWLQLIKSPFISAPDGSIPIALAVAGFFKTLAPLAKPSFMLAQFDYWQHWNLKRFMRQVGKLKVETTIHGIREFMDDAFMDAPAATEDGASESYFSVGAALTHSLAKNYPALNANPGIYPGALDVPLKAGFQMLMLIKRENLAAAGKTPVLFNGLSDRAKSRWLENQQPENN